MLLSIGKNYPRLGNKQKKLLGVLSVLILGTIESRDQQTSSVKDYIANILCVQKKQKLRLFYKYLSNKIKKQISTIFKLKTQNKIIETTFW